MTVKLTCAFERERVSGMPAGAMENKSLNIFNSRVVLASPETTTDFTYDNIERVIPCSFLFALLPIRFVSFHAKVAGQG